MRKLKCALVGCGDVSERYLEGIKKSKYAEMAMVMDKQLDVAKRAGNAFNVPYTDSFEQICNDETIDIIIIAVPHFLHAELVIKAAMANKDVFCDKPIATKLSDAKKMIEIFKGKDRKLGICYFMRYLKKNVKAKQLIEDGAIGKIIYISLSSFFWRSESYWKQGYRGIVSTDWRMDKKKSGGGQIMMNYSHILDAVHFITQLEVKETHSFYDNLNSPGYVKVEDSVAACLKFSNGAIGTISSSASAPGGSSSQILIIGDNGQIDLSDKTLKIFTRGKNKWEEINIAEQHNYDAYYDMLEDFFEAIINKKEMPISGEDGLNSLKIIKMLYGEDD